MTRAPAAVNYSADRGVANDELQDDVVRRALIEGEQSGEPEPFYLDRFLRRLKDDYRAVTPAPEPGSSCLAKR